MVPGEPADSTNPKADWYVGATTTNGGARPGVIFVDTEPSNWTHDRARPVLLARFFHHQRT